MKFSKRLIAALSVMLVVSTFALPRFIPAYAEGSGAAPSGATESDTHFVLPAAGTIENDHKPAAQKDKLPPGKAGAANLLSKWTSRVSKSSPASNAATTLINGKMESPTADDINSQQGVKDPDTQKPGSSPGKPLPSSLKAGTSSEQGDLAPSHRSALQPNSPTAGVGNNAGASASTGASVSSGTTAQAVVRGGQSVSKMDAPTVVETAQTVPVQARLANGLKILILENHEFPIISTLVWYRVGSRDEPAGSTGISHMVEHLMFQEVGPFKPGEIGSTIARVGGQFNGYTSDDFTTFFETLPSGKLEMALKIESDRMTRTRFSAGEIKKEIANINTEFENEAKDPAALLSRDVRAALFTRHPYRNPILGKKADVEAFTPERAKAFYDKYFMPSNATLVIAGDVNSRQAMTLVHKYFAAAGMGKAVAHPNVSEPPQHGERVVFSKYSGNKEVLQLAYHAPPMESADAPAMVVLERLLNGGVAGKLKTRLIDYKICAAAQANYEIKKEPGSFSIACTAIPGTPNCRAKMLEALDNVVNQLRDRPPSDVELKRARNQAEFSYFAECDGPYRAGFHLGYFDCLDKWQSSFTWAEKLRSVTAADLNRVAKKYLLPENRVVGWIAGTQAAKPKDSKSSAAGQRDRDAFGRQLEHVQLACFKENDSDDGPASQKTKSTRKTDGNTASKEKTESKEAPKPREKKSGIPAVIHDIPSALGNAVTGNIPGAVGNVGSAIINLPGVIGNIGTAATAIGKQIVQLKPSPQDEHISHHVLKNGIHLVVFESHISPIVQICGSLQAGEAYSPKNKPGLSLLAACFLNQGSVNRNRQQMISSQDDLGIAPAQMLKFESDLETIDFSARCLSHDLPAELGVVAETLVKPDLLDDGTIDKVQQEALAILKRTEETAAQKSERVLLSGLLDENSPFCPSDPSDRVKTISQADLPLAEKFFSSHIVPGATTIVFAGDCNAAEVFALAEKAFADWDGKSSHVQLRPKIRSQRVLRSTVPLKDSKKTSISFGQIMPVARSHPEYGNLLVADYVLVNHPMVSRFEKALLKNAALENAIASGDMSDRLEPISNLTCWSLSFSIDPPAVPVSVKTAKSELRQIARAGINAEECTEVKRYLLGSLPVRTQSTLGAIGGSLIDFIKHGDAINGYSVQVAAIRSASVDSVNKVIRNIFKPGEATIVIAGGAQSIKATRGHDDDSADQGAGAAGNEADSASPSATNALKTVTDTGKTGPDSSKSEVN